MTRWTQEQIEAIRARGSSILLGAAAGSGKTTVLVERVMRLVAEEGADIDRMLVVTFTRAAASDMKAKLSRSMNNRAAAGDARCREQLMRLDRASITTLHAFCAEFLRSNFEAAGVDPAFRILDDAVADRLRQEALDEALETAYAGESLDDDDAPLKFRPDPALLALDYGRGPSGVRASAEALMRFLEARPDPEAWLEGAVRCDDAALSAWQGELVHAAQRTVDAALVQLKQAALMPDCPANYREAVLADIGALTEIRTLHEYDALARALGDFSLTRARSSRRTPGDEATVEAVKQLRTSARTALKDVRLLKLPLSVAREDARRLSEPLRALGRIALDARALFEEKKSEQAGLTYNDLEHRALRALRDPDVAAAVRERFDYVFVDEYQDTSELQEALVRAVSRPDNLFMVGDVKQSIYRFRLAEPRLFIQKREAYGRDEGGRFLPLTRNFRSCRGILDFVNLVFERAMTGGDSEIVYDALSRLNPGDPDVPAGEGPDVELLVIDSGAAVEEAAAEEDLPDADEAGDAEGAAEALSELRSAEREGLLIARTIRRMMAEDPSLRYRDFAILTRSKAAPFSAMMPILLAEGIPAYADGAMGYYDSVEIMWVLAMLRLIANRRSDVQLIGALRSPVGGLTAEQLALIRIAQPNVPFCDAARAYAEGMSDDIAARLRAFFELYEGWRLRVGSMALGEFVRLVLDESGFYNYAGALPGGAQRQANLDQFVISAGSFDREQSGALTRFLEYTGHMRAKGDGDAAHLLGEGDDVVRMMTIHKSKGLEFRVVIGAQLARRYRVERAGSTLLAHRDLGVGISLCDPGLRTRRLTLPQAAIIERCRREDAAEELRILYVLMTRAQQRLLLVGTSRNCARDRQRWEALSAAPFSATSHLDVIMAARSAAAREGLPLHSDLEIVPAASILGSRAAVDASPAAALALLDEIVEDPERYSDPNLDAQLNWRYPDPDGARRPLKLTASGLIRELEGPEVVPTLLDRPKFIAGEAGRMTGAERGTAYHRAMQLMDLRALDGLTGAALTAAVASQLDGFASARLMERAQRDAVEAEKLARFLSGDMGLRLRAARTIRREWPFNVSLRASEALTTGEAGRYEDAELLVQGTIDCCFIEEDQWVLLDYKTDQSRDMDALRAQYGQQLSLYALALERITGRPVRERALCLISQDRVLRL